MPWLIEAYLDRDIMTQVNDYLQDDKELEKQKKEFADKHHRANSKTAEDKRIEQKYDAFEKEAIEKAKKDK